MAMYPGAVSMLLPETSMQAAIKPKQFIVHSLSAPWTVRRTYEFWRDSTNLESHFGIDYTGACAQYVDTLVRADANAHANPWALSVETASEVGSKDPWNAAQLESLARLMAWAAKEHDIPLVLAPSGTEPGFGYHSMHPEWSLGGTYCPGDARRGQFPVVMELARKYAGAPQPPASGTYTVADGDTLWGISQKYGVTVEDLKAWNKLTSDTIGVGQVLAVRPPAPTKQSTRDDGRVELHHLKWGKTDWCVEELQEALIKKGYDIPAGATGYYGSQTRAACSKFQHHQGWRGSDADGFPGLETIHRLGLKEYDEDDPAPSVSRVSSPVPGHGVTYPYGVRNSRYAAGFHTGHDYAAPHGAGVVAVRSGTIAWSNARGGAYGNWIGLRADNGRDYVYCHLSSRSVTSGQKVKAGQRIGRVGATGNATGPHLHFEDRPRGGGYGQVRRPSW